MPFDVGEIDLVTNVLIETRDNVERGWCQWKARSATNEVCMIGAIPTQISFDTYQDVNKRLIAAIRLLYPEFTNTVDGDYGFVPTFNDTLGRTKEEVLSVIDCAIGMR